MKGEGGERKCWRIKSWREGDGLGVICLIPTPCLAPTSHSSLTVNQLPTITPPTNLHHSTNQSSSSPHHYHYADYHCVALKLYGVEASILILVFVLFVLYCIVLHHSYHYSTTTTTTSTIPAIRRLQFLWTRVRLIPRQR